MREWFSRDPKLFQEVFGIPMSALKGGALQVGALKGGAQAPVVEGGLRRRGRAWALRHA